MKTHKRSQTERAFVKGYQAGIEGKSRSLCPHETGDNRHNWLSGWREGREDHWDGYNRAAQAQKMSSMQ